MTRAVDDVQVAGLAVGEHRSAEPQRELMAELRLEVLRQVGGQLEARRVELLLATGGRPEGVRGRGVAGRTLAAARSAAARFAGLPETRLLLPFRAACCLPLARLPVCTPGMPGIHTGKRGEDEHRG